MNRQGEPHPWSALSSMSGLARTMSRRRFCAALIPVVTGVAAAACSRGTDSDPRSPTTESPASALEFPNGFSWGVATSAYQIEGAVTADGRGRSIWDTFCARPGTIADGSSGAVACDHYHRWESDLDLMRNLGIGSYRFSIAWPRVLPEGRGRLNRRGLDFYDRLVDGLLARGISPLATLYHWDLPQALQDQGGWENRDSAEWFGDYATAVFSRLGDRVGRWLTINETKIIAQQGYQYGRMAPGKKDPQASGTVIHHLNLAHARGVAAFRASNASGRIGPCLQLAPCYPADGSPEAAAAARAADVTENTLYLDPLLKARYPTLSPADASVAKGIEVANKDGDLASISEPVDFVGVNYYSPLVVDGQGQPLQPYPVSAAGWQQIYPQGLHDALTRLRVDYASPELLITENGVPDDETASSQPVDDHGRVDFLRQHLQALHQAIGEGSRVTGYFAWSLLDNFEWAAGYSQRWGLVAVDFDSLERSPKTSASWYSTVALSNKLPAR
jgi:beta-glucosidase